MVLVVRRTKKRARFFVCDGYRKPCLIVFFLCDPFLFAHLLNFFVPPSTLLFRFSFTLPSCFAAFLQN